MPVKDNFPPTIASAPPPVEPPVEAAPPAPAEHKRKYTGPAYVTVLASITPTTHPKATAQYAAGMFYKADRFLRWLWMSKDGKDFLEAYTGSPEDRPVDETFDDEE